MKIAVIGAGLTGLAAAHRLLQKGHQVSLFEKENFAGGLASGFKEPGWDWSLEYFYHHLFTSDKSIQELLKELGLFEKLFFVKPKTSSFFNNEISRFDSPLSLLTFPYLSFLEKTRAGLITFYLKTMARWQTFENTTAYEWLRKYYGQKAFEILWEPLLKSKFGEFAEKVSMAWFWARIKKRSMKLGYLEGGFQVLIDKLVDRIKDGGGKIYLKHGVSNINDLNLPAGKAGHLNKYDRVIDTRPLKSLPMLGAINLILVLKEPFLKDKTYWLNITQKGFPFVAVVEHTNFIEKKHYGGDHLLYVGGYYPQNHRYFKLSKEEILQEFLPFLQKINPKFKPSTINNQQLTISLSAQPVMFAGYQKIIPSRQTSIPNVLLANIQQVYPWDRQTNYAIELGEKIAHEI
ncbi:MAG: NAD(P)/FAD-dependent oxidoreductase [bacterium]|nr:NAD(P)/FAD-dependent oxidoreductase [bacterium]